MQLGIAGICGRIGTLVLYECLIRKLPVVMGTDLPKVRIWDVSSKQVLEMPTLDALVHKINTEDAAHGMLTDWIAKKRNADTVRIDVRGRSYDVKVMPITDPSQARWSAEGVEFVEECTGKCLDKIAVPEADLKKDRYRYPAQVHYDNGAKLVLVSAPANDADQSLVMGINHEQFNPYMLPVFLDNGSCTTKTVAFVLHILHQNGIGTPGSIYVNTTHADTGGDLLALLQGTYDPVTASIREHSSGARNALQKVLNADGVMRVEDCHALALRVPVVNGSAALVSTKMLHNDEIFTTAQINDLFRTEQHIPAYAGGIYVYEDTKPLLNSAFISRRDGLHARIGRNPSSVISPAQTVVNYNTLTVLSWYNNEGAPPENQAMLTEYILACLKAG